MFNLSHDIAHMLDPVAFAVDRLGFVPDAEQARAIRSPRRQKIMKCCRQWGKSSTTSVIALHTAVYEPGSLILLVSPSLRQSRELFGKVTEFMRRLEPAEILEEDNKLSCTLQNRSRIVSLPGDPKTVRGFSAPALIIEDEAAFVADELHTALRPMLAVSEGKLILISSPFGRRGHFFDVWTNGGPAWERIEVKATDCPRISPEFLEQERAALGDWRFRQEFLCEFVETDDQLFGYDLIMGAFDDSVEPLFNSAGLASSAAMAGAAS
jgi:hypothetical protein